MNSTRSIALRLLAVWALFILYGTTLPFDLTPSRDVVAQEWHDAHRIPWQGPDGGLPSLPDAAANVLLFLPWGFLVGWDQLRRGRGAFRAMLLGAGTALAASVTVEFLQLFSSSRTTSATDLVTNTTGGASGALLGVWVRTQVRGSRGDLLRNAIRRDPATALAFAVAAGVMIHAIAPFDVSLDVGAFKASLKSTRLLPFGPPLRGPTPEDRPGEAAETMLAWAIIGGTFALAAGRRLGKPMAGIVGLALAAETSQLFIRSRTPDATTVLLAVLGGTGGAMIVGRMRERPASAWTGAALLAWTTATLLDGLAPGRFAVPDPAHFSWMQLLPFIHYFQRTDVYALADAGVQGLAYLPAGFLLAIRGRPHPLRDALVLGALVAGSVEIGQIFLPDRVADITDVAVGAAGAALGAWIRVWARRVGGTAGSPAFGRSGE
jgi:VanZ family protein